MIGIALIYFVGKAFYDLAARHNKSKWGFAILGVVSYYLGIIVGGGIVGGVYEVISPGAMEHANSTLITIMAIPLGVLSCWGFYKILQRSWAQENRYVASDEVLDANLVNDNPDNINESRL